MVKVVISQQTLSSNNNDISGRYNMVDYLIQQHYLV